MKKLTLILFISLLLSMLLASCDNQDKIVSSDSEEIKEESEHSEKTLESETQVPDSNTNSSDTTANTVETSTNAHVHSYGEWITITKATCKKSGTKERICHCGKLETKTISKISHQYVNNVCSMCKQKDPNAFVSDYGEGQANEVGSCLSTLNYTSQSSYVYFAASSNKICKMKTNGTDLQTVYKTTAGSVKNINVVGDWIYFYCEGTTIGKSYIAKVRTDGSKFEKIVSSLYIWDMLVVKDTVYYTVFPANGEYKDFAKDLMPLYSISVNGGTPKQLYDGAVSDMVSDGKYLYFIHADENHKQSIVRIKHGSTVSNILLSNKELYKLSIEDSKLYFFTYDVYNDIYSLASIATNGANYTTYGNVMQYTESMHIVGNKAYYMGSLYIEDGFSEKVGLIEYDLATNKQYVIKEYYETFGFAFSKDILFFENYNYETEKLESLTVYYVKTDKFKEIKLE